MICPRSVQAQVVTVLSHLMHRLGSVSEPCCRGALVDFATHPTRGYHQVEGWSTSCLC
jgi:hypothetical protein